MCPSRLRLDGNYADWTHFLVRLNLKKFDRTRKKLIGREKPSIGQENVSEQIEMGQDIRPIKWEKTRLRD